MESSSAILWDLVDRHDVTLGFFAGPEPNRRSFNQVRGLPRNTTRWHTICSLIGHLQDWLPGGAGSEPRLGCRFCGVNYEKGACTGPLFHFYRSPVVFGPGSCLTSPKAYPLLVLRRPRFLRRNKSDSTQTKGPAFDGTVPAPASASLPENGQLWTVHQKNERPVGAPAARAWGWRE